MSNVLQDRQNLPWEVIDDYTGQPMPGPQYTLIPGSAGVPLVMGFRPVVRTPWQNEYSLQRTTITDADVTLDMSVVFRTSQDITNCNCWEFEEDAIESNVHYNGGWQARFGDGHWWYFRLVPAPHQWISSGIPIRPGDFIPGQPTHITAQYQRVQNGLKFQTLTVQGQQNVVNIVGPSEPKNSPNHLNYAWQLDSKGNGAPINIVLPSYQVYTQ